MKDNQKYSTQDFDIEALAASLKLLLSHGEAEGFLADIADMANYIHSNLPDESAESALALCICFQRSSQSFARTSAPQADQQKF